MKNWEEQYFENCFKLKSGDNLTTKNMSENAIYPVFGGNGIAGYHNKFNLSGSNVIIGRVGALCGNARHITEKIWLTDNAFKIVDFKFNFDHSFLTYLLNYNDLRSYARQAAQPVISNSSLKDVVLRFPKSVKEQQRIVSILDECFAAIDKAKANAEQNLKNAKELFESYLQGVFEKKGDGWVEKTLKEVCAKITDGTHQTPKYFDDGVIFLSSKNVTTGKIDWGNIKYIDEKQHLEMHKRVAPRVGDILLAKNGTTGVAAMVDRDVVFDIYVSLAHIRVLDEVITEFMLYFINSPVAKKQFNKRLKGSGVPNLHLEEIREVMISFPKSKDEQQTIVRQLDALRAETQKLEAVYQKKIVDLEELKKSILQKAFAGELKTEIELAV
ncbi:MAG: restriction endonuclease subunit S [Bacteroidetes bacterium]|nr:MAG: restriction endonuclease subunit S [Bacteroidota bacterium]